MKRNVIKLTENDLHKIIKESINKVLINEEIDPKSFKRQLVRLNNNIYMAIGHCDNGYIDDATDVLMDSARILRDVLDSLQ